MIDSGFAYSLTNMTSQLSATRLRQSTPGLRETILGAALWGGLMALSAFVNLTWQAWEISRQVEVISMLFALGGFLAFPVALFLARLAASGKSAEARFAAAFVSLAVVTITATALIYALDYRQYYSEWHDHEFSRRFVFEFAFTVAAALYQFAVLGLRLFFPLGLVALIGAGLWFARLKH